ncbi:MAG TPA: hypothetical protein PK686_00915 [bacterium]|nr:hypothetical protein [bacterium]HPV65231.1 hypothetical protein [bacterium]
MRKMFALLLVLAALSSGCEKEEWKYLEDDGNGTSSYTWPGYPAPKQVESLGRAAVSGFTNVYDYTFRMHLDGSQTDPNPLDISSFAIPHVGPGGVTIYTNVSNDATYTITKIENGYIHYTIRSQIGHTLKYNLAKRTGSTWTWFLRYGLTVDNGIDNMVTFTTN